MRREESARWPNVVCARERLTPSHAGRYDAALAYERAGVAQLVEYELPKLGVAGSIPVARSTPF